RVGASQKFVGGLSDHSQKTVYLHTATHLLQQALRIVLGTEIYQKGSNITHERLRFDFPYHEKLTDSQKQQIEDIVNEVIQKDLPIYFEMLTLEQAKEKGALGVFEEKYKDYGEKIKVYMVGREDQLFSQEICGGPHAPQTGFLGTFKIQKEESVGSGIRRIKAILLNSKYS
ncbi:alanine--tRNA ligase, partial [Candidatus Uhrbacteria bacterium CG_4_9_14_3_um_filter_36_7]